MQWHAEADLRSKLIGNDYDKMAFPWADHGSANVTISTVFHKVLGVDLYGGTMKVSVWLRLRWNDPRLRWNETETGVKYIFADNSGPEQVEIWFPDVTLWNAVSDISSSLGLKAPRISSNGDVFWTRNGVMEVSCNFLGLEAYPYGRIGCELEMGSWVHPGSRINLELFDNGVLVGGSLSGAENARHVEYTLVRATARRYVYGECHFTSACADAEWPVVLYSLILSRASVLYTFKILVPQIILTMVAFSTFWLSPECGERLGLAITVPLAVAVYDLLVFSSLPTSNKINFVSAMGLLAFLFSMAVLIENALAIQLFFYREANYISGLSSLAGTMLSYRQQSAWVAVLQIIHELKLELAKRQQMVVEGVAQAAKSAVTPKERHRHALRTALAMTGTMAPGKSPASDQITPTGRSDPASADLAAEDGALPASGDVEDPEAGQARMHQGSDQMVVLLHATPVKAEPSPASAGPGAGARGTGPAKLDSGDGGGGGGDGGDDIGAGSSPGAALRRRLGRGISRLRLRRGKAEGGAGAGGHGTFAGASPALSTASGGGRPEALGRLLSAAGPEALQVALQDIIDDEDPGLHGVQRTIAHAALCFGSLEVVAARLHALLTDGPEAGSDEAATLAEFKHKVGDAYNLRWKLLSAAIDHACRWIFVLGYVTCVVTSAVMLTRPTPVD